MGGQLRFRTENMPCNAVTRRLSWSHVQALFNGLSAQRVAPFADLAGDDPAAIGLRVDLCGRGRRNGLRIVECLRERGLPALLLIEPLASGFGYAREGRFIADPSSIRSLAGTVREFPLGILARPGMALAHSAVSPVRLWRDAIDAFANNQLDFHGIGSPIGRDAGSLLSALWLYRAAGQLRAGPWLERLDRIALQSYEWLYEELPPELGPLRDGIASIEFSLDPGDDAVFMADFLVESRLRIQRRLHPHAGALVHSTPCGWIWVDPNGEESELDTDSVLRRLSSETMIRVGIVIDASHLETAPEECGRGSVRPLPWPFHSWMAIASDVDWTTHEHFELQAREICDRLALPFSGSAYLLSRSPRWPAWCGRESRRFEALCAHGLIDTVHGLIHSFNAVLLRSQIMLRSYLRVPLDGVATGGWGGVLLEIESAAPEPVSLEWETSTGRSLADALPPVAQVIACDRTYLIARFDPESPPEALAVSPTSGEVLIRSILLVDATGADFRRACASLSAQPRTPSVFTAHGGGAWVAEWGQCWSDYGLSIYPERAPLALDHPLSPFYAMRALREAGICFFNPLDLLFQDQTGDIRQLVEPRTAQDGTCYYAFRRYLHTDLAERHAPASWSFGKHAATATALPAVIQELLRRFQTAPAGEGAIIYTHLGNRVGNQTAPRLGWPEDLHAALSLLAEHYHGRDRDCPVPFRVWVDTAGALLAYAAVLRGIERHLRVQGSSINIRSWHDPAIGCTIPDIRRHGGAWLHGLTIYVEDPPASQVTIDDLDYPYFTHNPVDASGRPSITLVDARDASDAMADRAAHEVRSDGPPVEVWLPAKPHSLRNVTHWQLVLERHGEVDWQVGFETEDGDRFWAGEGHGNDWVLDASPAPGIQRVLAMVAAAGPRRPTGRLKRVCAGIRGCGRVLLHRVAFLRPWPGRHFFREPAGPLPKLISNGISHGRFRAC